MFLPSLKKPFAIPFKESKRFAECLALQQDFWSAIFAVLSTTLITAFFCCA